MGLFSTIFGSGSKAAYDTSGLAAASRAANQLYLQNQDKAIAELQPYLQGGAGSMEALNRMLGVAGDTGAQDYGYLTSQYNQDAMFNDPGYQFRLAEGQKAIERSAAARGGLNSPATMKALQGYGQGVASEEYQNAFNRDLQTKQNIYNMLAGVGSTGQLAAGQAATERNIYATAKSGNDLALQQAILGSAQAKNAASQGAWGTLIGAGTKLGAAFLGSDRRIKENIRYVGERNGHRMYVFTYKGEKQFYEGVMAQDVIKYKPEAVKDIDGVMHVDYSQLGVDMKAL